MPVLEKAIEDESLHRAARAAAFIALAKVTSDPKHIQLLRQRLGDKMEDIYLRETAAIALGLLRRTAPKQQFDGKDLDDVRSALGRLLDDDTAHTRSRAFAAYSLGLLADQPADSLLTTADELVTFALKKHNHPGMGVAGLAALGLVPPKQVAKSNLDRVRAKWRDGVSAVAGSRGWLHVQAGLTLGRLGDSSDIPLLAFALDGKRPNKNDVRCAVMGLGFLAERVDAEGRHVILQVLQTQLEKATKDKTTLAQRGQVELVPHAIARTVLAQLREEEDPLRFVVDATKWFLERMPPATLFDPHSALAAGQLAEALLDRDESVAQKSVKEIRNKLDKGMRSRRLTHRIRGACIIAIAPIATDKQREQIDKVLADRKQNPELRTACATAWGRLGERDEARIAMLQSIMMERRNSQLTNACINALGRMGAEGIEADLAALLAEQRNHIQKGTVARALANLGTSAAAKELLRLAEDPDALTRHIALAGLGRLADPEEMPSAARLVAWLNWRALTDSLNEMAALL